MPVLVVEDDVVLRLVQVVLDPTCPAERCAAFADYMRHDLPDFTGWIGDLRCQLGPLYPATVRMVADQASLHEALPQADAVVVESLTLGPTELDMAPKLRLAQRFGTNLANIDTVACRARGIAVRALRRRTNIAVAEHAFALIAALAKKLNRIDKLVTPERLVAAGHPPASFDRRHTARANWGRISGLMTLHGATLGLFGFGEIGREMARIARGFGMRVLYTQRTRLDAEAEATAEISFATAEELVAASDVISLHVPLNETTRGLIDAATFSRMKLGALLINTARAPIVDRDALVDALRSGRLGGTGFDVLYAEPTAEDDPLLAFDNVILTPHLAGGSRLNGLADMAEMLGGIASILHHDGAKNGRTCPSGSTA